jgi:hypothetical protein
MLHNVNVAKQSDVVEPKEFMRDIPTEITRILSEEEAILDLSTEEGRRKATQRILEGFAPLIRKP